MDENPRGSHVTDLATGHSGTIVLNDPTDGPLMPTFSVQKIGNSLAWGSDHPVRGAVWRRLDVLRDHHQAITGEREGHASINLRDCGSGRDPGGARPRLATASSLGLQHRRAGFG